RPNRSTSGASVDGTGRPAPPEPPDPGPATARVPSPASRTLRDTLMLGNSPFFQLYRARLREFWRQPARIFWVYGFPTVLAVVLGYAFQSRPPAPIQADLVESPFSSVIEQAIK